MFDFQIKREYSELECQRKTAEIKRNTSMNIKKKGVWKNNKCFHTIEFESNLCVQENLKEFKE